MKTIILLFAFALLFNISFAQHDHKTHQSLTDTTAKAVNLQDQQLAQMLVLYYNIKNALVSGDANAAASNADRFLATVRGADFKVVSEATALALSKGAEKIALNVDLKKQREAFATFSENMVVVAKTTKPGKEAIYLQYCPMKKASWLSSEKQIRNPYYGSSMLTCGEVTETL